MSENSRRNFFDSHCMSFGALGDRYPTSAAHAAQNFGWRTTVWVSRAEPWYDDRYRHTDEVLWSWKISTIGLVLWNTNRCF